jgi:hypothetical protein
MTPREVEEFFEGVVHGADGGYAPVGACPRSRGSLRGAPTQEKARKMTAERTVSE